MDPIMNYTIGHTKRNTKKDQRYHSEIYLADNILYENQTIKITASYDVWMMTKSVVSVTPIVGYNHCHNLGIKSKSLWMYLWGTEVHVLKDIAKVDLR
ncbi:uncharacterized protein TNCV_1876201 [Trichonephila clavipes]|nr:uncharacterized protein TNCV_1876201 [Trichonephila clavipes]